MPFSLKNQATYLRPGYDYHGCEVVHSCRDFSFLKCTGDVVIGTGVEQQSRRRKAHYGDAIAMGIDCPGQTTGSAGQYQILTPNCVCYHEVLALHNRYHDEGAYTLPVPAPYGLKSAGAAS